MFQLYKRNKRTADLLLRLGLSETDHYMLWIVDMIESAFLPFGFYLERDGSVQVYISPEGERREEHPAIKYFEELLNRIRRAAKSLEISSLPHRLTCNPPEVIKDIFNVCYYYQLPIEGDIEHYSWIPMVYLCTCTNSDYHYDEPTQTFISRFSDDFSYTQPDDALFYGFIKRDIKNEGSCIIPRLTEEESAVLPSSVILVYDFSSLSSHLLQFEQLRNVEKVRIPTIEFDYSRHMNVYAAILRASELVFEGKPPNSAENLEIPMATPKLRSNSVSFLNQDSRLPEIEEDLMSSQMLEMCSQTLSEREKNLLQRELISLETNLQNTLDESSMRQILKEKLFKYDNVVRMQRGILPCSVANDIGSKTLFVRIKYNSDDYIIQELFSRPPDASYFDSKLLLTEELAKSLLGMRSAKLELTNKINDIVLHWFRIPNRKVKHLHLEVTIEYVQESEIGVTDPQIDHEELQFNDSNSNAASELTINNLNTNSSEERTFHGKSSGIVSDSYIEHQKNNLTQSVVKYSIDKIAVEAISLPTILNYKPTIVDFAVGTFVQFGPFAFVIQEIDPKTRIWYEEQLRMLRKIRNNLEIELIRAGQIDFCETFAHYSDTQIEKCAVKMRLLVADVMRMFRQLSKIKSDINLQMFRDGNP